MEACLGSLLNSDLSSVLSVCEPELQELMRQIDIMMSQQRSEWEAQMRDIQLRLKGSQEEMSVSRVLLHRKDLEIGVLRKQLQEFQTGRQDLATKYEKQLGKVSDELDKLKRSYQKLERRRVRKSNSEESKSKEEDESEVRMLNDKLEEYSQSLVIYQKQLAELEAHKKSLNDELAHIKAQCASERQHATCCSDVQHMRAQLEKVHHELHTQELERERFRALENPRLANDRREQQDKAEEVARLHNDVSTLKHVLHDKEQVIRSLEERAACRDFAGAEKLCEDLERTSAELDRARTCEAQLNSQVMRLKQRLEEMSVQHMKLGQEAKVLKDAFDSSVAEVKKLREELLRAEQRHSEEVDVMRKQADASPAASLASLRESCVTEQDHPQLRPELAQTPRPPQWAAGGDRPAPHGHASGDNSKTPVESGDVGEGTSYEGDIQNLFTQLRSLGPRRPPGNRRISGENSTPADHTPEGCSSASASPPVSSCKSTANPHLQDARPASPPVDATVSRFLDEERLHSKELLHKLDTHILGMGDSIAASIAKRLNAKSL
ncbi:centrosomal protein of 63 kDa isoform X2 [Phycodurus eques]|uniref:centrosomal protein of 63 kDa isoform X2 n=1 Tax=Phycodurus eques TaxID=693459 RepID=UPI002ACE19C6|nr:centrosomal protein of 63 kDa isoform X2 [Phycodurus eques]